MTTEAQVREALLSVMDYVRESRARRRSAMAYVPSEDVATH